MNFPNLRTQNVLLKDRLVVKYMYVSSHSHSHYIVVRVTVTEYVKIQDLTDEDVNAEGLPSHLTPHEKGVLLRRVIN